MLASEEMGGGNFRKSEYAKKGKNDDFWGFLGPPPKYVISGILSNSFVFLVAGAGNVGGSLQTVLVGWDLSYLNAIKTQRSLFL